MKRFYSLLILGLLGLFIFPVNSQAQDSTKAHVGQGRFFVDKNGDGYNDNAPDDDGDGIPNSLDPDWQKKHKHKRKGKPARFIDLNGDGINDNMATGRARGMKRKQLEKPGNSGLDGKNKTLKHRRRKNH